MQEKNKRIVKNTGLLYFRSAVCMLIGLYSSRLILEALGVSDHGIYNAVGGFVSMFWLVSTTLSSSIGRFLNIEMGKGNKEALNEVFSISQNTMFVLGILTLVLAETFGMLFLSSRMTIPPERMFAAKWVFHISVFSLVIHFIYVPFSAAVVAHEKMGIYAITNVAEVVFKFLTALYLCYGNIASDKLIVYALLLATGTFISRLILIVFARLSFPECRFRPIMLSSRLREMVQFSFWNFIGSLSRVFCGQGVNMALNVTHGPVLNSARGLAGTVSNAVGVLVNNFTLSLKPQITQSYAANDIGRTRNLVFRGTKFASFLMLLFIIPLILETDTVLSIWLTTVPDYTAIFVRLTLVLSFINTTDHQFHYTKLAVGRIRNYQLTLALLQFINFPLALLLLKSGASPVWVYICPILIQLICVYIIIQSVKNELEFCWIDIFRQIYAPVALVIAVSLVLPLILRLTIAPGFARLLVVTLTSVLCTAFASFYIGSNSDERSILKQLIVSFLNKFSHDGPRKKRVRQ